MMFSTTGQKGFTLSLACLLVALGCAGAEHQRADSPTPFEAASTRKASSSEQKVLRALDAMPAGKATQVGDYSVVPEAPYQAASGRTCRKVMLSSQRSKISDLRLACSDGTGWQFVPDVFSTAPEG